MDGGNRDISVKQLHYHPSVSFISIQKCILRKRKLVSALGRNVYRSMIDIERDLHYHLFYKFRNIFVSNHCFDTLYIEIKYLSCDFYLYSLTLKI